MQVIRPIARGVSHCTSAKACFSSIFSFSLPLLFPVIILVLRLLSTFRPLPLDFKGERRGVGIITSWSSGTQILLASRRQPTWNDVRHVCRGQKNITPFRREVTSGEYGSEQRHDLSPGLSCNMAVSTDEKTEISTYVKFFVINVDRVPPIECLWLYGYLIFQSRFQLPICHNGTCGSNRYRLCVYMPSYAECRPL